ncbi:hypothetical protein [Streptomyces sp. HPF1205]|uniref:hypothetical protein n=1 Tax=Streptomyces sp. HPF1205 TaxID=2873262 RepID=UPI001CED32C7|nr:hypothetical protein [Streptomyces sp. HPF1205]
MDRRPASWPDLVRGERLLHGAPADPDDPGEARFAEVVRAVAALAGDRPVDPGREEAALAAFRAARERRGHPPVRPQATAGARPAWKPGAEAAAPGGPAASGSRPGPGNDHGTTG